MKTISEHIKHIHTKPHHIRRQIAFTAAATGAGLLAAMWLVGSVSTGVFALKPTSFADSTRQGSITTVPNGASGANGLAGAAAAVQDANGPARILIVDVVATTTAPKAEQTTIPF